jgi:hypothetical protein
VNDQWRIWFTWSASGAGNVELVDYHFKEKIDGRLRPDSPRGDPSHGVP